MANGMQGAIGIGKETDYGVAVPSTAFFTATEGVSEERGRLREPMTFGSRAHLGADAGRLRISGAISDIHARPSNLGHLLRAAIGVPVTTGAGPYEHVFTPTVNKFSAAAALPPYSATIKRGPTVRRYSGGQLSRLEFRQDVDEALQISTDWIFRDVDATVAAETQVLESAARFLFKHLEILKGGDPLMPNCLESFTLSFESALETIECLDGTDVIKGTEFSDKLSVNLDATLQFNDGAIYDDFANSPTDAWQFKWEIPSGPSLLIDIPQLSIEAYSDPISGPGRMTISLDALAEFNTTAGYEVQVTLENDVAAY